MAEVCSGKSDGLFKTEQVLASLRSHIVSGEYRPGHRLPTFAEMEATFSTGRAVIQQAVDVLKRDGFVRSVNRRGLYVVPNPPHLHQYGLVFAASPGQSGWTQLTTALTNEAHCFERRDAHAQFRFIYGLQDPETRSRIVQQLREDIDACRLAGLILTCKFDLLDEDELAEVNIPTVRLWTPYEDDSIPTRINTDTESLLQRALTHLKDNGRQRIAIVHMADTTSNTDHAKIFAEAGLELHHPWIQHVGRSHPQFAENIVTLLMDYRSETRPDGLIIADDNLVESASRGLVAAGVRVGEDCDVVAHTNWPWPPQNILPMTRIGFDVRDILRRAIASIDMQIRGDTPPPSEVVPALFEWEVDGLDDTTAT